MSLKKQGYKNKVVWVVGASSGIGRQLALDFYNAGAICIISARTEEKLAEIRKDLEDVREANEISRIMHIPFDVAETHKSKEIVEQAVSLFGKLDILVLAAGIANRDSALDSDFEVQEQIMRVNHLGPVSIVKYALPYLIETKGHICVLSSVLGKVALPYRTAYCASKFAMHGFFESLRSEVAHLEVKICLVVLGSVKTNMSLNALTTAVDKFHDKLEENIEKGFSCEYVSRRILEGVLKEKEELVISQWKGIRALMMKRFMPATLSKLLKKRGKEGIQFEAE